MTTAGPVAQAALPVTHGLESAPLVGPLVVEVDYTLADWTEMQKHLTGRLHRPHRWLSRIVLGVVVCFVSVVGLLVLFAPPEASGGLSRGERLAKFVCGVHALGRRRPRHVGAAAVFQPFPDRSHVRPGLVPAPPHVPARRTGRRISRAALVGGLHVAGDPQVG